MFDTKRTVRSGGDSLAIYLREIGKSPLLTPEEEESLARRVRKGDGAALERLTSSNLRSVVKIAKAYRRGGIPLSDLINEGNIGLMRAAKRFDPEKGVKFISYASWWIRQAIQRAVAQSATIVRLPMNKVAAISRLGRARANLAQELGREPTVGEIAKRLDTEPEGVSHLLDLDKNGLSLDEPLGDEGTSPLSDFLKATTQSPEEEAMSKLHREGIKRLVRQLTPREANVINLYFGLDSGRPLTLEHIGKEIGISRERVRQLKERALKKLRNSLEDSKANLLEH